MPTISGRVINLMSKYLPGVGRRVTTRHIAQHRATGGKKGNKLAGKPTFLLDVLGRTSGVARPVMLMLVRRGDALLVTASNGGNPETPNWYKNLMAAGGADVEVGDDRWAVIATELPEGDEREECWTLLVAAYPDFASYQELTGRRLPVAVLQRA